MVKYFYYRTGYIRLCPKTHDPPTQGQCMRCELSEQEIKRTTTGAPWYGDFKCTKPYTKKYRKKVYIDVLEIPQVKAMGYDVHQEDAYY